MKLAQLAKLMSNLIVLEFIVSLTPQFGDKKSMRCQSMLRSLEISLSKLSLV